MTDVTQRKCPICGTKNPRPVVPHSDSLYMCSCCGLTDNLAQFKADEPAAEYVIAEGDALAKAPEIKYEGPAELPVSTQISDTERMTVFYPPYDVTQAVEKVEHFFYVERGAKEWAYGRLQSRDTETHPNLARAGLSGVVAGPDIELKDVKRLAMAFGCVVVPAPNAESELRAAKAVYETTMRNSTRRASWVPWEELSPEAKAVGHTAVSVVKSELGFGL